MDRFARLEWPFFDAARRRLARAAWEQASGVRPIVKAFVVLAQGYRNDEDMARQLQDHVKRALVFMQQLPRTETGKLQRFKLRDPRLGMHAAGRPARQAGR